MQKSKQLQTAPRVLIPAAGFGRRVGLPLSKEMLLDQAGRPLIADALDHCESLGWSPLVISRAEKTDLIAYLEKRSIETLLVAETKEWPETILRSQAAWRDWNLLYLPDVEFAPPEILQEMWQRTQVAIADPLVGPSLDLVAATFSVDDPSVWGCLEVFEQHIEVAEKPKNGKQAWGFLLFRRAIGQALFESLLASNQDHNWKRLDIRAKLCRLDHFYDLTRSLEFSPGGSRVFKTTT